MEFLQLYYFATVANSESMTKAAETLFVSQSTLSMSIKKLEREFNIELFSKTGRQLRLTDDGILFLEHATHILSQVTELRNVMTARSNAVQRVLTIAADAIEIAVEAGAIFAQLYPDIELTYLKTDVSTSIASLLSRKVDMYISFSPCENKKLSSIQVLEEPLRLIVHKRNGLSKQDQISLHAISTESLVIMQRGTAFRTLIENILSVEKIVPRRFIEVDSQESMAFTVANSNSGITFMPCAVANSLILGTSSISLASIHILKIKEAYCKRNVFLNFLNFGSMPFEAKKFYDFFMWFCTYTQEHQIFPTKENYMDNSVFQSDCHSDTQ